MSEMITPPQMYKAMVAICDTIEEQKGYLSDLDGAIGDGDHGVNMAKCFRLVKAKLDETPDEEFATIINNVAMVVLNSVGGAMGALYGTLFMRMSQASAGKTELGQQCAGDGRRIALAGNRRQQSKNHLAACDRTNGAWFAQHTVGQQVNRRSSWDEF